MYRTVIIEQDPAVRSMLLDIICWQDYQFEVITENYTSRQIMDMILAGIHKKIDFILCDVQEPQADILELLTFLYSQKMYPVLHILCDYTDIHLMRNAFRYGASDYLLKPELSRSLLCHHLQTVSHLLSSRDWNYSVFFIPVEKELEYVFKKVGKGDTFIPGWQGQEMPESRGDLLIKAAEFGGAAASYFFKEIGLSSIYVIVDFEIDAFCKEKERFGNDIQSSLVSPFVGFVSELPFMQHCIFASLSAFQYILFCPIGDGLIAERDIPAMCREMQDLWLMYMNLSVTAGISRLSHSERDFHSACLEAERRISMKFLLGFSGIYTEQDDAKISIEAAENSADRYSGLCLALKTMDEKLVKQMQEEIVTGLYIRPLEEAKQECLYIIYQVSVLLRQYNIDFWKLFQKEDNYYARVMHLNSIAELECWVSNYLRHLLEYMQSQQERHQEDSLHQALRFIAENFMDPGIASGSVASYIEMDEKIFMTRFTRVTGTSFHNYIISLRISRAKELLVDTTLSLAQISLMVGFNSVEHFSRLFYKVVGVQPELFRTSASS